MANSVVTYFSDLPDPRSPIGRRHLLDDVLTIAICGVICGADSWAEIEQFGRDKQAWLSTFLALPHGIPSHDTFGRVFAALDPEAFERCFAAWMKALVGDHDRPLVAVDGKTLRRSFERASSRAAIHMVSAFASSNRLVLGQIATEAKSNEITAIPKLLELLELSGTTVTIDAMGCQKQIARTILERGGDYVLAVKENQPSLHQRVKGLMDEGIHDSFRRMRHDNCTETEGDHGRIETRQVWCTPDVQWLKTEADWPGLRSLAVVESTREINGEISRERRYFISSLTGTNARTMAAAIRGHWCIENQLHWSLDMGFREDECRVRMGNAAQNFSRLRRIALNLLKQETSAHVGIKAKRLKAGWNHDYLLRVLQI